MERKIKICKIFRCDLVITKFFSVILQRVERASSEAAREVFGNNYQSVLEQVHVDDDALVEGKATSIQIAI